MKTQDFVDKDTSRKRNHFSVKSSEIDSNPSKVTTFVLFTGNQLFDSIRNFTKAFKTV